MLLAITASMPDVPRAAFGYQHQMLLGSLKAFVAKSCGAAVFAVFCTALFLKAL